MSRQRSRKARRWVREHESSVEAATLEALRNRARGKVSPPGGASPEELASSVERLIEQRRADAEHQSLQLRLADAVTNFTGSMTFVALHVLWFGGWIAANNGLAGMAPFDPFPHSLLTMVVSLEAIFLSSLLLISQNRMRDLDSNRSELDLHVNLLAEREATEVIRKLARVEKALGIEIPPDEASGDRALMKGMPSVDASGEPGKPSGNGTKDSARRGKRPGR